MSSRIRGITIELDGNTTGLQNAIKDVEKRSNGLAKELKDVEQLLKFNPGNVELLAQKQQLLTERIGATAEKLDTLKAAQAQVEAQFQSGDIGVEQYRAFQRELVTTEGSLNGLRNQLQRMTDEQERVADSTRQLGTFFQATGTDIDQFADALGSNLTNAIRNGTATSQQLEQALDQIGQAALGAGVDLDRMRATLRTVDSGNDIAGIGQDLLEVERNANRAEDSVREFGSELSQTVGGLVAGGGIAGVVSAALDTSSLDTKIDILFNVPEESKQSVKSAIREVGTYGIEAEEALEGVRRQWALNKDASDESNAAIVKGAALIASAYTAIDFGELIQEANEIGAALGISNEEAMGMVNTLLKMGFPPEQLDIIAEYGEQLATAGYNAEEIQNILAASVETKSWNIDNLLDGLKEAKIGLSEFGNEVPKALGDLLKKTDISAKQMKTWGAAVAEGGEAGSVAMVEVAKALAGIEDATLRNEIGVQVFGTKFEDQGMKLVDTLLVAEQGTANLGEGIKGLNDDIATMDADPAVKLQEALANMMTALQPILTKIAEVVTVFAKWAAENPVLLATIAAISTVLGVLMGIFAALAPVVSLIISNFAIIKTVFLALTGPIGLVIAAIMALIAIGVALYKNWDDVKKYTQIAWKAITAALTVAWNAISSTAKVVFNGIKVYFTNVLNLYKTAFSTAWNAIKTSLIAVWNTLKTTASSVFNGIKNTITTIFNNIKSTITSVWNAIKSIVQNVATSLLNTVRNAFNGMLNTIRTAMNSARTTISNTWNNIMSFFRRINLFSIGKDIINGLIRGISSKAGELYKKATNIANSIKDKIAGALKIKSPSRVMMELGKWIPIGLAKGIENNIGSIEGASDKMIKIIESTNRKITDLNDRQQSEIDKIHDKPRGERLAALKDFISKEYQLEKIGAKDEIAIWEYSLKHFKLNSVEQREAALKLRDVKLKLYNDLKDAGEEYVSSMKTINDNMLAQEKALTEEYKKAVDDRAKSLYSFAGIFDEIETKTDVTGSQLIKNLRGQVDTLRNWSEDISSLSGRGLSLELLEELQEMGPKAAAEIKALTTLTGDELSEYNKLWEKKSSIAKSHAVVEMTDLRIQTENQIDLLHHNTAKQLEDMRVSWVKKMGSIANGTASEMDILSKSMPQIGHDIISGLISGLDGSMGELVGKAKQIADTIKNTVKSALDINSPSGVFKGFGINVNEGFVKGIQQSSNKLQNAVNNVYGGLSDNVSKMSNMNSPTTTNNNITNSTPINISLNYSGNASEEDALRMVNIIDHELANRQRSRMRMSGVR